MSDHRKKNNKNNDTNAVVSVVLRLINYYSRAINPSYVNYRIRPQSEQELTEQAGICLSITPGRPQIIIGGTDKKAFTFGLFLLVKLVSQIKDGWIIIRLGPKKCEYTVFKNLYKSSWFWKIHIDSYSGQWSGGFTIFQQRGLDAD
jgi:hypothetical protein